MPLRFLSRPRFKPHFRVTVVPPDLVFLQQETSYRVMEGRLYAWLALLLDGRRTAADLADRLDGKLTILDVDYGLAELRKKGCLARVGDNVSDSFAALRKALAAGGGLAHRLKAARASLIPLGALAAAPGAALLRALGVRPSQSRLDLVVVDDPLCAELDPFNRRALRRRRPWMLVKPVGAAVWVGPLFDPGRGPCWRCLAQRLRQHRPVDAFLEAGGAGKRATLSRPLVVQPARARAAMMRAANEASRWIARSKSLLRVSLLTYDTRQANWEAHEFLRWDSCPLCGGRPRRLQPMVLRSRKKLRSDESGSRAARLEETFARLRRHVDPVTGIVHDLQPYYSDKSGLVHVYVARHAYPPGPAILSAPPEDLFWRSWGKGATPLQAKTSALCEALERYSGIFRGTEACRRATYRALRHRAIHPNACLNFSERQYRRRAAGNRREARHNWVPQRFDDDRPVDWTPVWSLTEQTFKYVPTAYCYYGYPLSRDHDFCRPDSNGNAAGSHLEEAILQGFLELVERDCVALWWYNRLWRPAVALDSFDQPYFDKLIHHYRRRGRRLWVLDLTHDLGIPAVAALSRRHGKPADYLFGFGAHLDPEVAILRALTEMNQFLSSVVRDPTRRPYGGALLDDSFLLPDERARPRGQADFPQLSSRDLHNDIRTCVRRARERGLETLVLDQTRPDTGLSVAKVIVPGLRQFWARFAPGRLYDVPVRMGWRTQPLREDQLNPVHLYM